MSKITNSLKYVRTLSGMTQVELSAKSTVSLAIICGLENGKRTDVRLSTMLKISNALDKPIEEVFASFFTNQF